MPLTKPATWGYNYTRSKTIPTLINYLRRAPIQARCPSTGRGDHLQGAVQPDQSSFWPAVGEDGGAIAGPATQVNHMAGRVQGDAARELATGPGALFIETKILIGIPSRHDAELFGGLHG